MTRSAVARWALLVVALQGCAEAADAPSFVVRDSAQIRIAENTVELPVGAGGFSFGATPSVSIGTLSGDAQYQFSRIRGAARLSDGRIAVLDRGSSQLRIYSSEGIFERAWGREGGGPGEFVSPALAGRLGDTLLVLDNNNRRISRYHPDEGLIDEYPIDPEAGGFIQAQGTFASGAAVTGGGFFFSSASGQELSSGLRRDPTGFRSIGRDGVVVADFGRFPGLEMFFEVNGPNISARVIPFGKVTHAAVGPDRLFVGTGDEPSVHVFDEAGAHVGFVRWVQEPRPVESTDLDAYLEDALADADDDDERRRVRSLVVEHPADLFPAHEALEVDRLGLLWVAESFSPSDAGRRFRIFDPDGRQVARIELAPDIELLEVGEDYVLTRRFDEFDVEYVEIYALDRGAPGSD